MCCIFGDRDSLLKRFERETIAGDYPCIRLCQVREQMTSEYVYETHEEEALV